MSDETKDANKNLSIDLQQQIVNHIEAEGLEKTIQVLCRMLSIIAENHTGGFEVEDDSNGVVINVDVFEDE